MGESLPPKHRSLVGWLVVVLVVVVVVVDPSARSSGTPGAHPGLHSARPSARPAERPSVCLLACPFTMIFETPERRIQKLHAKAQSTQRTHHRHRRRKADQRCIAVLESSILLRVALFARELNEILVEFPMWNGRLLLLIWQISNLITKLTF